MLLCSLMLLMSPCPGPLASRGPLMLADNASRTVLMSAPKAGATQTTMLMLSMLNLTQEALSYSNWVHLYRVEVFSKSSAHRRDNFCNDCGPAGRWTCIRFLRSPLDRIVSSYFAWSWHPLEWPELALACRSCSQNASFAEFLTALAAVGYLSNMQQSAYDSHVMPQTPLLSCGSEPSRLFSVPVEAMPDALLELDQLRTLRDAGATVWQSGQYRVQLVSPQAAAANASSWPWPHVKAAILSKRLPPYDSFLTPEICSKLSCLFAADFSAWTRMCAQPELLQCRSCVRVCTAQLLRFRSCGCSKCDLNTLNATMQVGRTIAL